MDYFLDPQKYYKGFVNNKPVFDRKLTLIDCVSQFSTGSQDDYVHARRHTLGVIDVVAQPVVM